tara:strand:- start:337 stop:1428 length:1092 start_codon:yes stop_codon:yes gene_type:complete
MLKVTNCLLVDEALTGVQLVDRISVPTQRTMTDAGQMHVPCKFARTGSQLYTAKQLGLVDADPSKIITVWREAADVFDEASLESFRSAPVTVGHPLNDDGTPKAVSAENAKELQVGMLEGMPLRDEDTLGGTLVITAKEAIDAIEEGTQELSAGYICDIEEVDGKYFQRNIRANHIAIVAKGRAGTSCRISDEADLVLEDQFEATQVELADAAKLLVDADAKILANEQTIADMKEDFEKTSEQLVKLKLELVDAKLAAEDGVVERCSAIENARLIADIRDLGDKSVMQIERLVVEDQMPDKDLSGKSEAYISAMFEILVDASKGETPMGKLLRTQAIADTKVVVKPVDKVAEARLASIARSSK